MTADTLRVVDTALSKYRDYLFFAEQLHDHPKGHIIRRETARSLWAVRKARIELGLFPYSIAHIVLPRNGECA